MVSLYQLPMLECSNCGQHLGHMYEDYYTLTKKLMEDLANLDVPVGTYKTSNGNDDLTPFIKTYYTWYTKQSEPVPIHLPGNIIARGLLRLRELKDDDLPFGSAVEDDGQMSIYEPRICCLRMFQTDPKMTKI